MTAIIVVIVVNANALVDLLLELNIINVKDVDNEIGKLAARLIDPRAQQWFKRVPRYFLINIDRLLKEPYKATAEPRTIRGSKYYADPRGGWVAGRAPEGQPQSPLPVREQYDPKERTYTTALHEPVVQRDIEQSFTPFKPAKAKAKRLFGEPPTKKELQPWMTAPEAEEKEFHHFDPIQTRRRELFGRLSNLVNFLNYQTRLVAQKDSEDPQERANAQEAEKLLRSLVQMRPDDIQGFRNIMKEAGDFAQAVKDQPWLFTKDGQIVAQQGDLIMRKVIFPETAVAFAKRGQPERTSYPDPDGGGYLPVWCTKTLGHATTYTNQGPLYYIDKGGRPYVLAHFPTHQVYGVQDTAISAAQAREIAPLFADEARFSMEELRSGSQTLAQEVGRIRGQRR